MDAKVETFGNVISLEKVRAARDKDKAEARVLLLFTEIKDRLVALNTELEDLKQHLQQDDR